MDIINKYSSNSNEKHYLQCVVTAHKSTHSKYLANSGALIIYHPENERKNYIYLGDEFLASGYGVSTLELSNKLETIAKTYNDTIDRLDNADIIEKQEREEEDNKIWEEIKNYVQINGGNISKTVITLANTNGDKTNIPIKNIILHGEEAQYENLKINDITITINKEYEGQESIIINNKINIDDYTVFLPVGSIIHDITIDIDYSINDSGGIKKLEVLHHNLNPNIYASRNIDGVIIDYDDAVTAYITDVEHKEAHIKYQKILDEPIYVNRYLEKIISEFFIYVRETPKSGYKLYPGLKDMYDIEIPSAGNIIKDNIITVIKNINIRPQYYIYKGYDFTMNGLMDEKYPLNSFNDYDYTKVIYNIDPSKNIIYISVPSCFAIQKIYIIKNNIEKYNWTGAIDYTNNINLISYLNNEHIENFTIPYNVYRIYTKIGFINSADLKLEIQVIYKNTKLPNDADYYNNETRTEIKLSQIVNSNIDEYSPIKYINDEEFNSLYWIKYDKLNDGTYEQLKNKLELAKENCAKRT